MSRTTTPEHNESYWGNQRATLVKPKEYQKEKLEVARIVYPNLNHSGIARRTEYIDRWLQKARDRQPCRGGRHLENHWDSGIRGRDVLVLSAALYRFWIKRPDRVVHVNHLIKLTGNRVIRMIPYSGFLGGSDFHSVGIHLYIEFRSLFLKIHEGIEAGLRKRKDRKRRMHAPLEI